MTQQFTLTSEEKYSIGEILTRGTLKLEVVDTPKTEWYHKLLEKITRGRFEASPHYKVKPYYGK